MADVAWLLVGGLTCLALFVVHTVRSDTRAGTTTQPGWRGWLLVVVGVVCVAAGSIQAWRHLFSL